MQCAALISLLLLRPVYGNYEQQQRDEQQAVPCSICGEGQSIGLPEKIVKVPTVGEYSCSQLDIFLPLLYPDDTDLTCQTIQSVGALCGCPVQPNACSLCPNEMAFPDRPLEFFSDMFGGISPTCELLGAYLQSLPEEDPICSPATSFLASYCGCDGAKVEVDDTPPCSLCSDGSNITLPNENIDIEGFPFPTCRQLDQAVSTLFSENSEECGLFQSISTLCGCPAAPESCNMCPDGSSIAYPDKPARFLKDLFGGIVPTCQIFEAYAHSLDGGSQECGIIQLSSGFCGCPPISENHCRLCDDEVRPEYEQTLIDKRFLPFLGVEAIDLPITCELVISMQFQLEKDDPKCTSGRSRRDICGCNDDGWDFLQADTKWKKILLISLPRISGTLSLIGAIIIILHVVLHKKTRGQIYNQLVAAMSIFDVLSSSAWIVSTAANDTGDIWPVLGEGGSAATCTAQGFFVQIAVTSILYNASLTVYYFLTIVLGWRGTKLKKLAKYLHIVPLGIGLTLAFIGIPYYDTIFIACHLPPPPLADSWAPLTWLLVVPVFFLIAFCSVVMGLVWLKVHKQAGAASKWRFRSPNITSQQTKTELSAATAPNKESGSSGLSIGASTSRRSHISRFQLLRKHKSVNNLKRLEYEVMWQALSYLVAMYTCWIIFTAVFYKSNISGVPYPLYCVACFLMPFQGCLNCFIYFRPRATRYWRQRRRKARKEKQANDSKAVSNNGESSMVSSMPSAVLSDGQSMDSDGKTPEHKFYHSVAFKFDSIDEPAAYFAKSDDERDDSQSQGVTSIKLDVAEELAELEFAEERIEEFQGES